MRHHLFVFGDVPGDNDKMYKLTVCIEHRITGGIVPMPLTGSITDPEFVSAGSLIPILYSAVSLVEDRVNPRDVPMS